MSGNHEIWNLSALCRCCHSDGYFKSLQEAYVYEQEIEIYSKMLRDTISVEIVPPAVDVSYTICEECIQRLRDAYSFKKQVLLCERKFEEYCKNELMNTTNDVKIELDDQNDFDDGHIGDDDFSHGFELEIQYDGVVTKKEENDIDASLFMQVKCEEDNKTKLEFDIPKLEKKNESKGTDAKKKRDKTKPNQKRGPKSKMYDPSLEVQVKTDTGILYSCGACGGNYPDQKTLKCHIMATHSIGKYKCFYCDNRFITTGERNEHLKTHTEYAMNCSFCDKVFYTKVSLKEHMKTHTRSKVFTCDLCSKDFAHKSTLVVHLRGHYGTKKRCICHVCGHGFNDSANLRAHILTVHEKQRPFSCELCPKSFTAKKHLKQHMLRHTEEPSFFCDQCPKRYYCGTSLTNHKRTHTDHAQPFRYTCKVCRRRFTERGAFVKHLRRAHIGQKPHKCSICDKDFVCKYSMKRHELEHSGVKPFECEVCNTKFKQRGALNRHVSRKHGVPKDGLSEKCEVCNKLVTNLTKHMQCHNEKKYPCEFCDKSYSENNVLTRHKKVVHFGIKPHVCEYCDKKYVKVQSLKNHQLKVHKIVSKIETDEDFDSAVAKFSIKNRKGKIKTEELGDEMPFM